MTIELKEDIAYILLKKLDEGKAQPDSAQTLTLDDFAGRETSPTEVMAHLDYLNQKGYVEAEFSGDAYAAKGPNPAPAMVTIQSAQLTDRGSQLLAKMNEKMPDTMRSGPSTPISSENMSFLEKVMLKGHIADVFDARDISEVIFRTMRDLMTTEASKQVESELHEESLPSTDEKTLQNEVAELWRDTNPLVRFLSNVRPPLKFDADTFIFRVQQEAGLPKDTGPKTVITAVFSATKEELSQDRITKIAGFLPGEIREMWESA
ncbi:DUF2267 domain-containing protein [Romeria aff. gracilis LEGE 07310]|uniref:DUF2267 domain-containing protein n=1 Tax=Vasconcelosia minhoensis LEGE 07310 TaxID=915328 RepID=A0A8J7AGY9_9CYAN|nr:DUF2267 domain-containing protein [Romeria gracilis]MBE9077368.1 DUF2267 domain-containing protein [Romeria aff. gracilis LEGE 07310]